MTIETGINILTLCDELEERGESVKSLRTKAWEIIDEVISKEQDKRREILSRPIKVTIYQDAGKKV